MAKGRGFFTYIIAAVFVLGTLVPVTATAAPVLTVSSCLPTNHDLTETYLKTFHEPFNERAKGEAELKYIGGPEVTPRKKQAPALKRGLVDLIFCPAGYYEGLVSEAGVLSLSNLPTNRLRERGALDLLQPVWAKKLNAMILAWCCYGVDFHIYTTFEPKESKATGLDLSGIKMRSTATYNPFFKAMGAIPVNMSATEIYTGLQRGVVQGMAWPEGTLSKMGVQKFLKYRIYPGFFRSSSLVHINLDKFNSLPKPVQDKLVKVGIESEGKSQELIRQKADVDNEKVFKAGLEKYELKGDVRKAYLETIYGAKWKDSEKREYDIPVEKIKEKIYQPE